MASLLTDVKFNPPSIPSARISKYQKLKELENEYFEFGQNGKIDNQPDNNYLLGSNTGRGINETNPYLEKEIHNVTQNMKAREKQNSFVNQSWDRRRNSGVLSNAASNILI
jgi:hypothetical protein